MERLQIAFNRHGMPELCRFEGGELYFKKCYARSPSDIFARAFEIGSAATKSGSHIPWSECVRKAESGL